MSTEGPAASRWRALVERRARQMDGAYEALGRTSADFWARRLRSGPSMLRRIAGADEPGLQTLIEHSGRDATVIDVGAGAGRYALAIAARVRRVVAVEPDEAMLPLLQQAIAEHGMTNIDVIAATWQEANVDRAEGVFCAHVLYPIADAVPFLSKLDDRATRVCVLVLRDVVPEPEPLGALWQRFHGEPRYLQPGFQEALAMLEEMGFDVEVELRDVPGPSWSYTDLDAAVDSAREHLILGKSEMADRVLRTELRQALEEQDGVLRLPVEPAKVAALWWLKR
jgi:FkbM family methyltransferase